MSTHTYENLPAIGDSITKIETFWEPRNPRVGEGITVKPNFKEIAEYDDVHADVIASRLHMIGQVYPVISINRRNFKAVRALGSPVAQEGSGLREMAMLETPEGLVEIPAICCEPMMKPAGDFGWASIYFESGHHVTIPVRRNEPLESVGATGSAGSSVSEAA